MCLHSRAVGASLLQQCAPNNSFKPNLLRYTKHMAEKACHVFGSTTQVGLTQALGCLEKSTWVSKQNVLLQSWFVSSCHVSCLRRRPADSKAASVRFKAAFRRSKALVCRSGSGECLGPLCSYFLCKSCSCSGSCGVGVQRQRQTATA